MLKLSNIKPTLWNQRRHRAELIRAFHIKSVFNLTVNICHMGLFQFCSLFIQFCSLLSPQVCVIAVKLDLSNETRKWMMHFQLGVFLPYFHWPAGFMCRTSGISTACAQTAFEPADRLAAMDFGKQIRKIKSVLCFLCCSISLLTYRAT